MVCEWVVVWVMWCEDCCGWLVMLDWLWRFAVGWVLEDSCVDLGGSWFGFVGGC
jgi:hypothetical protein